VTSAKQGCFSKLVRVTGYLLPAQLAVVTLELDGYRVSEIFAQEGDRVTEGGQLVRLTRVGQPQPGQPEMPATIVLKAPAGGRIEKSTARIGEVASTKGDPLFRIAGDTIELQADVPSLYLSELAPKQVVRIASNGHDVMGEIKRISPQVDKVTQMGQIRAIIAPDHALRIGSFVRATIEAGQSCGVSVPRSAVNYGTDGTTVQVVRAQTVETHRVRIGLVSDQDAEIREGVRIGDVVVAHAGTSLRDGDAVTTTFVNDTSRTEGR
jgi:HlyD family secretion protein